MRLLLAAIAVALLPTAAVAAEDPYDLSAYPAVAIAAKMTVPVAAGNTSQLARKENTHKDRWPLGARITVNRCKVKTTHRGTCQYDLDGYTADYQGWKVCRRRATITIDSQHRTHTRSHALRKCEVKDH